MMKKILALILVLAFAISLSACQLLMAEVGEVKPANRTETPKFTELEEMTTADRWEINETLSHFVDTGLKSFDRSDPLATDLLAFAVTNAYHHNYQSIKQSEDGQYYYLTAEDVSATLREYFDFSMEHPLAVTEPTFFEDGAYYWPCADGAMATEFVSVSSLIYDAPSDLYEVTFDVLAPEDLFATEIGGFYSFSHEELTARNDLMKVGSGSAMISYREGKCIIYTIRVD